MASQEDTDDLYADLYGGDASGAGDVVDLGGEDKVQGEDEQDLIGYEEENKKSDASSANKNGDTNDKANDNTPVAPSSGSFIPPPSSAQPPSFGAGLQIKGSFIPPAVSNHSAQAHGDVRDLTPASHNDVSSNQQDASHQSQEAGQALGSQPDRSEGRALMPHEMPEEGKMFVGGLNWDTTEDSLRRYFSQFGEVGNCTIMRDNATGRSRGFAFLNFVDPKAVNTVMVREHYLDGKVIDPKRAIPRPQHNNYSHSGGGGAGGGYSAQSQKLFVGGLPPSVTPESFRRFFEQYGTLLECTCMMDRETGKPRGFGFLTYQDDAALERVLTAHPIVFDGKEVDVKRAQSKNDPQSLQARRQQRTDDPGFQQGGRYGMGTGSNNYNAGGNFGNNAWGMNPMMMGMMGQGAGVGGQGGFDPNAMAQMYQSMGWGNQNWNPQMAWQQMMASMAGQGAAGANMAGMDMGAVMNSMGMGAMGGMGMMGGMGNMSPPMANAMSPTMGTASANGGAQPQQQRSSSSGPPTGPSGGDDRSERGGTSSSRYQRGGSHSAGGPRSGLPGKPGGYEGSRDERERSPRSTSAPRGTDDRSGYRRERSPNRRNEGARYDNSNRNRY